MKQLRVLKHLFKHVQAFLIALEFWSEEREKPEEGFMQAMRLKTKLYVWKAFPFDWECSWNFQPEILPKWKVPLVSGLRIATKSI